MLKVSCLLFSPFSTCIDNNPPCSAKHFACIVRALGENNLSKCTTKSNAPKFSVHAKLANSASWLVVVHESPFLATFTSLQSIVILYLDEDLFIRCGKLFTILLNMKLLVPTLPDVQVIDLETILVPKAWRPALSHTVVLLIQTNLHRICSAEASLPSRNWKMS